MDLKKLIFPFLSVFLFLEGLAQPKAEKKILRPEDTVIVNKLLDQSKDFFTDNQEKSIRLSTQAFTLADKINYPRGKAYALKNIGIANYYQGEYLEALDKYTESVNVFEAIKDNIGIANLYNNIGVIYYDQGDDIKALENYLKSLKFAELSGDKLRMLSALNNIGGVYNIKKATYDKALEYYLKALPICEELKRNEELGTICVNIGSLFFEQGDDTKALYYFDKALKAYGSSENSLNVYNAMGRLYKKEAKYDLALKNQKLALSLAEKSNNKISLVQSLMGIGMVYLAKTDYPTAINYFKKAEIPALEIKANHELEDLYQNMALAYSNTTEFEKAFKYQALYSDIKDTIYNIAADKKLNSLQFDFDLQTKQNEINLITKDRDLADLNLKRQKFARNTLAASLLFVFVIAFVLFKLYRKVGRQTIQLRRSLEELRSTQAQLIQSEKMASLGALTAGIGHEIQNPLNFVNNFSELNVELLHELQDELLTKLSDTDKDEVAEILADLSQNMGKINHHGKRADAIIKGMLLHSRQNTGQKALTNINALAEEYLQLSYHGLSPKDKSIKIDTETSFEETINKIEIIPQDLGRVLLNLYNNAFYSVIDKKAKLGETYEPVVSVKTEKHHNKIEIRVKDNGLGIQQKFLDKIFQPFFTTKPTGQGTGLGLSLSYDIIKAHRGELKVQTKEGEFAEFTITLPAD